MHGSCKSQKVLQDFYIHSQAFRMFCIKHKLFHPDITLITTVMYLCALESRSSTASCLIFVCRDLVPTDALLCDQTREVAPPDPRRLRGQSPYLSWHDRGFHVLVGTDHDHGDSDIQNHSPMKEPAASESVEVCSCGYGQIIPKSVNSRHGPHGHEPEAG